MVTKLQDPMTAAKMYWAVLIRLLYKAKISATPSLLVNGKFASDFCEKANLFHSFFASICTQVKSQTYHHYFHIGHCFILWKKIYH